MTIDDHLLVCLMEEAAEVQKAAAKALRFGLDDTWTAETGLPEWKERPREELLHELNDLAGVVLLLRQFRVLPLPTLNDLQQTNAKRDKVLRLMDYARSQGRLPKAGETEGRDDEEVPRG